MAFNKKTGLMILGVVLLIAVVMLLSKMNKPSAVELPKESEPSKPIQTQSESECTPSQVYDVQTKKCVAAQHFAGGYEVEPSEDTLTGSASMYQSIESTGSSSGSALPKDCFPKDQLSPADLLPADCNSKWAQSVPQCQGELGNVNFLTAGSHIGINTIGQSLRNANRQLRSDPPNPQMKVSPWLQSTIEPDVNRRPLEIGAQA
jgi:hypothetical protein